MILELNNVALNLTDIKIMCVDDTTSHNVLVLHYYHNSEKIMLKTKSIDDALMIKQTYCRMSRLKIHDEQLDIDITLS